jgi:hypothetical protein
MNGKSGDFRYLVGNSLEAFKNKKLDAGRWKLQVKLANRAGRRRVAMQRNEGLEYQYALTDIHRAIIKKVMMTPDQAYQKNKVTKQLGLAWVQCG